MDDTLAELIGRWPGRWKYPRLATELHGSAGGALDSARAAELVLAGLADPFTEAEGVHRLIDDGEFAIVESLLGSETAAEGTRPWSGLDGGWSLELPGRLEDARQAAVEDVKRDVAMLHERAERIGCGPGDLTGVEEQVRQRRADAQAVIDLEAERLQVEEAAVAADVRSRLPPDDPRTEAVEACLKAGEFPAALRLLNSDWVDDEQAGPHTVLRPPVWPWYHHSAATALSWYEDGARLPFPQLARFVRARRDPAAASVLNALRDLVGRRDTETVGAFAVALGRLLGEDLRSPVDARDGGFETILPGLDDARLPRLPLLPRRPGATLWIADPNVPPPGRLPAPVVWFVPDNAEKLTGPPGTAVLDLPRLLCLLTPPDGDVPPTVPSRRINLLRAIVPQLDLDMAGSRDGIELNAVRPRDSLAWLLDLRGVGADAVVLDTLDYETGRHPLALQVVLAALLESLRGRSSNDYQLTLADLEDVRTPAARGALRDLLFDRLDAGERAMLGLAGELFPDEAFEPGELADCAHLVGLPETVEPEQLLNPSEAAAALVTSCLFEKVGDGRYRIARTGIGRLFRKGADWDAGTHASEALDELLPRPEDAQATARAWVGEKLVERNRHRNANIAAAMERAIHDARDVGDADPESILERFAGLARQLREGTPPSTAIRPPEVFDLGRLIDSVAANVEWGFRRIPLRTIGTEPGLRHVFAVRELLAAAFENLLTNAGQAIQDANPDSGGEILVTVGDDGDRYTIDIEDTGPGLTDDEYAALTAERSFSTKGGRGSGSGVRQAREDLRAAGGGLEIARRSDGLGGAHIRAWLPSDR